MGPFQEAVDAENVELADWWWHRIAEHYLISVLESCGHKCSRRKPSRQLRGAVPTFRTRSLLAPQRKGYAAGAAPIMSRQMVNLIACINELIISVTFLEQSGGISSLAFGGDSNAASIDRFHIACNLWRKVRRELIQTVGGRCVSKVSVWQLPTSLHLRHLSRLVEAKLQLYFGSLHVSSQTMECTSQT